MDTTYLLFQIIHTGRAEASRILAALGGIDLKVGNEVLIIE